MSEQQENPKQNEPIDPQKSDANSPPGSTGPVDSGPPGNEPPSPEKDPNTEEIVSIPELIETEPPVHAHHAIGGKEKKEFKHYLFEFFMLFLAVFAGFFAEYKLEETIEHHKEKEYIQSIIRDIGEDTTKVNVYWGYNIAGQIGLDSLINAIHAFNPADQNAVNELYRLYIYRGRSEAIIKFTDRTLAPLKSSGNFRIIRSQEVSDSLLAYDDQIKSAQVFQATYHQYFLDCLALSAEIFDSKFIRMMWQYYGSPSPNLPTLLNSDTQLLGKYANMLELWKEIIYGYNIECYKVKLKGQALIPYLKDAYNIRD